MKSDSQALILIEISLSSSLCREGRGDVIQAQFAESWMHENPRHMSRPTHAAPRIILESTFGFNW